MSDLVKTRLQSYNVRDMAAPEHRLKGVILAGGYGTRLLPMTRVTNKHLLPVYDRPMIHYPLDALAKAGIEEVVIVTGGHRPKDFKDLIGDGAAFGFREIAYALQEEAAGIADALRRVEDFAEGRPLVVMLGDNLFQHSVAPIVEDYRRQLERNRGRGARITIKAVNDPERFGVIQFDETDRDRIQSIFEKPKHPPSRFAVVGLYMYDARVFEIIRELAPSARGEFEITDVNRAYLERGELEWSRLEGWWSDAGTVPSLHRAARLVAERGVNSERPAREQHLNDLRPRIKRETRPQ